MWPKVATHELVKLASPYSFPTFNFTTTTTTTITTITTISTMSSTLASFAIVIYTTNETTATAAISTRGEDEVKEEDKDEYDDAIGKSILLGRF